MSEVLAPGGGLAQAIPHYEDRAEQRVMSEAVAKALEDARPLIVEAGTGTGKTLAYLIPALLSGKRVVVSTGTRTLQDQIARHDVPLLRSILAKPFAAVVLKGVGNYVCKRKLAEAASRGTPDVSLSALLDWAEHSETGDRAEVEWLGESAPLWAEVTTTPDARIGPRCPYFERCFITQARRAAEQAQLILVNHHLYFADRSLRAAYPGARVLPDHDAVIFDEAHQLEDVATEHFGARVSTAKVGELVRDAHVTLARMPLWTGRAAVDVIDAVERASLALFAQLRGALISTDETRVILPQGLFDVPERQTAWFRLDTALEDLARAAEAESEPPPDEEDDDDAGPRAALTGLARRARGVRDDLATIAEQRQKSHVYWGEVRPTGTFLSASPIDVADLVRRHVIASGPTPVFTSATLAAGGALSYTRLRLGLDDADELIVDSPFDFGRQAMLYVPRDLPPVLDGFSARAADRVRELLAITTGRAFLLFTSHRALREAAARLTDLPYPRLVQGDAPRAALIDRFRATPGAVLLGTSSFWEGVDVPGDALSLVVIDKLPFAPHTDPLVAARMQARAEAGEDPFAAIQLPSAAIALKQGFGRLIRRRDDRGIVAILDGRIVTKSYGRVFLSTLPANLPRTSVIEQVRRWWTAQELPGLMVAHPLVLVLFGYFAGAIPFGVLLAQLRGIDIREHGSGNIGATNVTRVLGVKLGAVVLVLDAAKGALPTWFAIHHTPDPWLVVAVGGAAIVGHCFSPFLAFTGGKGVATATGVFAMLAPDHLLIALAVFVAVLAWKRVPALGSLAGIATLAALTFLGGETWTATLAAATFVLLVYTHRENLAKLTR